MFASRRRSGKRSRVSSDEVEYNLLSQRLKLLENIVRNSNSQSLSEASTSGTQPQRSSAPNVPFVKSTPIAGENNEQREQTAHSSAPILHESHNSRFVGRLELIPEFNGSTEGMTIDQWLDKIENISTYSL